MNLQSNLAKEPPSEELTYRLRLTDRNSLNLFHVKAAVNKKREHIFISHGIILLE